MAKVKERGVKISEDMFKELESYKKESGVPYKKILELSWENYKKLIEVKE